ncbi:uncharacterized protein LOC113494270 [Trichoplusia ni]|uniref:Uncharacterized protein LOC113494270 n=1 Tax=Trichoplusia ni TaxID=7111 RepID=A0A7E5VJG2_TRINI|nr:uncharacterized protein LOC113494270 [Trichoplusia ni]
MSLFNVIGFIVAVLLACNFVSAAYRDGNCPPPSKVYDSKPKCYSDADCQKYGKVCCPNQFNAKSCSYPAPYSNGAGYNDKYNMNGGGGVYCAGVKCMPYEVCKPDPYTKKLRCQRP